MFGVAAPAVRVNSALHARPSMKPVWKPESTIRHMWSPQKSQSGTMRVHGIYSKKGLTWWRARAGNTYSAQYGVSTGLSSNVVVGLMVQPSPSAGWTYATTDEPFGLSGN
eukprot:TRINITY_DN19086_c0_g1_i1.p1 TRINITY_DN19086_c0_g1~~TRINITY_DN19086_c0_g1_i1.p1  ORF type:complete len:126 (+),score=12.92 TRINITY_DN19086_c0_g1_i1:49-378(+)